MPLEPSPELPPLESLSGSSDLGSLAQSARAKQLKSARVIMIIVGVLTIAVNTFMFLNTRNAVEQELQQELNEMRAKGMFLPQGALEELRHRAILSNQIMFGATAALGVVFVILGMMVYTYPVPVTILGLVLYIGAAAVFGFIEPMTLAQGWFFKIIVIVALVKSVQAAVAYQKG
jgi:hypothetical protein